MDTGDSLWIRYLPALVAAVGGVALLVLGRRKCSITAAALATLLGLICMEAEYWVAHGFPWSDLSFFVSAVVVTLTAVVLGRLGGVALGILGLVFFAYVNLRYGAPYLLDYVLPVFYAFLLARSRRELTWPRTYWLYPGWAEGVWIVFTYGATFWRTTTLHKWAWIAGKPW